jgi:predicted CxxxxCH...CXXCH cytochrome family protein
VALLESRKLSVARLSGALVGAALLAGLPWDALASPGMFEQTCIACHPTSVAGVTCAGCHAHGVHGTAARSDINFKGTTNKTSYAAGETVTVTLDGGDQAGWLRTLLLDQKGVELGRTTGPNTMGGGPALPVTLSGPAPAATGMYTWQVRWFGNRYDSGAATFGRAGEWIDDWEPNHGSQVASTNPFFVGSVPKLALAPASLDFGSLLVNTSKSLTTSLQSVGNASLTVSAIAPCAGTSAAFSASPAPPFTISAGGAQTLTVRYAPTAAATNTGCIAITSNDLTTAVTNLAVTGVATTAAQPTIALSPNPVDFGGVGVNGAAQKTLAVSNTGTGPLTVSSIALANGTSPVFTWSPAAPFTVAAGAIQNVTITYAPLWEWVDDTTLTLGSNAANAPSATVAIKATGYIAPAQSCTSCHGDATRTPSGIAAAPPVDTKGNTLTAFAGVGAHLSHLTSTRITGAPVSCSDCHASPTGTHPSGVTEFAWSPLARTGGLSPSYDFVTNTCASTYCHGATITGGTNKAPKWTQLDGTQAACGTCHGIPPPAPHTTSTACGNCHTGYTSTSVNAGLHVNGLVDVVNQTCTSCHGTDGRAGGTGNSGANPVASAPPVDTAGASATTARGVGAHLAHLTGTRLAATPVPCAECHVVPTSTTHANGTRDLAWGTLTRTSGLSPSFNTTTFTCSNTWCHGGTPSLQGGTVTAPKWTQVDGTQAACGTCHGIPPPAPHSTSTSCGTCHTGYTATTVNATLHLNGVIDSSQTCTSCHGTAGRAGGTGDTGTNPVAAAPPVDTLQNSATTARGVGAHLAHLTGTSLSANPVPCAECHVVPTSSSHSNGTLDLSWGTLARTGGLSPAYSTTTFTCSNTWCHGGTTSLQGGTITAPKWTQVDGTQAACGTCHGNPPPAPHVQNTACATCHTGYSQTAVNAALHLNGVIDYSTQSCTTCHGTSTRTGGTGATGTNPVASAPPTDTKGGSATTARGVGAHVAHLTGTTLSSSSMLCNDCHAVPTATNHANGTSANPNGAVLFSARTTASGTTAVPTWNTTALTCANTYCHGSSTLGGTNKTPSWTTVNGTQAACGTCHGLPPPSPHMQNSSCGTCHSGYTSSAVNKALHLNFAVDQSATCTSCHGTAGRVANTGLTGSTDANLASAPPVDTAGSSTSVKVGNHLAHSNPTAGAQLYRPLLCTDCHPNNAGNTLHKNGVLEVTLPAIGGYPGTVVKSSGSTPASCTVYCHGSKWPTGDAHKGARTSWVWNGPNAACGDCHAYPPTSSAHSGVTSSTNCGGCHPGYTNTTVNLSLHVNGATDANSEPTTGGTSCGTCHSAIVNPMLAGSTKVSKHTLGGGDAPTPGTTAWNTASTLKGSPNYASANCVSMCHGDHPHTVSGVTTHQYNVYLDPNSRSTTSSTTTRSSKDFDSTQSSGGLCTSCHRLAIAAGRQVVGTSFAGTAHQFTSKTVGTATWTWQYTLHDGGAFGRDCTKCHASQAEGRAPTSTVNSSGAVGPHSSDFGSLLAGRVNPGATAANLVCYNCHGNGTVGLNTSGKDLASAIASSAATSGGAHKGVNSDTVHATASESAATWNNGAFSGSRRHTNCLDCHSTHGAKAGLVARATTATSARNQLPPSMTGATGIRFSTSPALPSTACASGATLPNTCVSQTTAASFSTNPVAATYEYEVCFKCHSSFAFGNSSWPTATGLSGQQETDTAAEFSPNNRSGHPVVTGLNNYPNSVVPSGGTKALAASQLLAPWATNVGSQTMLCSDCHNTDAASTAAQGPHGSAVTFMLSGTNRAWPYTVAGANSGTLFRLGTSENNLGSTNGLFCRNCHPQQNSTSSNNMHQLVGNQHGSGTMSSCTNCHIRVPHGGKVSRLIVTTNAPTRYKIGNPAFGAFTKNTRTGYSLSGGTPSVSSGPGCNAHHSTWSGGTESW